MSSKISFILLLICYFNVLYATELYAGSSRLQFEMTPCVETSDCPVEQNSTCINKFCQCDVSQFCHYKIKTRVTKLNEPCDSQSDCNIPFATCSNKKCVCQEGRVPTSDLRNCAEPKNCTEKGYILSSINDECLMLTEAIGQSCKEDIQCSFNLKNSICKEGYCQCPQFYVFDDAKGSCIERSGIGMSCENDVDCENKATLTCIRGKCKCKKGLMEGLGMCVDDKQETNETKILSKKCNPGRCECLEELPFCTNAGKGIRKTTRNKFKQESKVKEEPKILNGTSFELLVQNLLDFETLWTLLSYIMYLTIHGYLLAAMWYLPSQNGRHVRREVISAFYMAMIASAIHFYENNFEDVIIQRTFACCVMAYMVWANLNDIRTVIEHLKRPAVEPIPEPISPEGLDRGTSRRARRRQR